MVSEGQWIAVVGGEMRGGEGSTVHYRHLLFTVASYRPAIMPWPLCSVG